ncbi:MAG: HepT-like ribonuclease domain-containing protein [Candidatus Nanopelagicales bacterium]
MTRTPEESLREARTHFALMRQHAQGDLAGQLVIDAICMRLSAGVEALARLDTPTRDRLFGDAWPLMWGMRNRIAHGYLLVDTDIVRRTLQHDIPPIMACMAPGRSTIAAVGPMGRSPDAVRPRTKRPLPSGALDLGFDSGGQRTDGTRAR